MSWPKSLVLITAVLTLTWAFYARDASPDRTRFPQILENNRFALNYVPSSGFGNRWVKQFTNSQMVEALAWNINTGMAVVALIAVYTEAQPMAIMSGVWMLMFSIVQTAVAISYSVIVCGPFDPASHCARNSDIQFMGIWQGYKWIVALVIVFYIVMGVVTLMFTWRCDAPSDRKSTAQELEHRESNSVTVKV